MKLITWDKALEKFYTKRAELGKDVYSVNYSDLFEGLENFFDEQSENGLNLVCFIDDKVIPTQFAFLFEKSDKIYKHSIIFLDEFTEEAEQKCAEAGTELTNRMLESVMEKQNVFTPMYIPSLRYIVDDEGSYTLPLYICRLEADSEKNAMYVEYQKETKKNAVFRGKETKGFLTWLALKGK